MRIILESVEEAEEALKKKGGNILTEWLTEICGESVKSRKIEEGKSI